MITRTPISKPLEVVVFTSRWMAVIGIILAVPQTPALGSSRETTLECTISTPGLESPCVEMATTNSSMI